MNELFLTHEDRMALLERAIDEVGTEGLYDYYGQLIEYALMNPESLQDLKDERDSDICDITQEHHIETKTVHYLRIVK